MEVATISQITAFVNAAGSENDISDVRIADYEVKLLTREDGTKGAIITGYLGNENDLYLPNCLEADVYVNVGNTAGHAMTVPVEIPVTGCADGVFDTEESFYSKFEAKIVFRQRNLLETTGVLTQDTKKVKI